MGYHQESRLVFRFIRCIIAGEVYCVRMSWVRGIRNVNELNINSGSSQKIGWLSTETGSCPVMSLNENLNRSSNISNESKKVLMFGVPCGSFGILVESVENIFAASTENIFSIPPIICGSTLCYFDEAVYYEKKLILSLSPVSIYTKFYSNKETLFPCKNADNYGHSQVNLSISNNVQKKIVIFSTTVEQSLLYGLSITQIPQILQLSSVLSLPGSEIYISGIIEWRNIILPVIDLSFCIERKKSNIETNGRILIVRLTSLPFYTAIIIQSQIIIQSFPIMRDLYEHDHALKIDSVHRQFKYKDKMLVVPDIDKIIMDNKNILT